MLSSLWPLVGLDMSVFCKKAGVTAASLDRVRAGRVQGLRPQILGKSSFER